MIAPKRRTITVTPVAGAGITTEDGATDEMLRHSPVAWYLLEYATRDGTEREIVWSAREGAPCVGIPSRVTEQRLYLTGRGHHAPDHTPDVGDRVWVDMTLQTARVAAAEAIEHAEAGDANVDAADFNAWADTFETRADAVDDAALAILQAREPHLMTVTSAWLEELYARRAGGDFGAGSPDADGERAPHIDAYDRQGRPISVDRCVELMSDVAYRRVAHDVAQHDPHDVTISTIWLGADHSDSIGGKPIIFETMVFVCGESHDPPIRYATEADALAGHARIVATMCSALEAAPQMRREMCGNRDHWPDVERAGTVFYIRYEVMGEPKRTGPLPTAASADRWARDIAAYPHVTNVRIESAVKS
jgi:hypothetical protein